MHMSGIPFGITDWSCVEVTEHKGASGIAYWRTRIFGGSGCAWLSTRRGTWPITGASRDTYSYARKASSARNSPMAADSHSPPG